MAARTYPGIRARHARSCERDPCRCNLSYEAFVYSKRDGRKLRKSFPSLTAAKAWRADALGDVRRGKLRAASPITLAEAAEAWLAGARDGSIRNRSGDCYKPSALRSYEAALRGRRDGQGGVLYELGAARLADVSRTDLQRLVGDMLAEGRDASTIRNTIVPLRAIYRDADVLAPGALAVNPTLGLRLPAVRGSRDRIASPAEAAKLIATVPARDRALWATAFYAGLRRGELLALAWEHVDLAAGLIRVERSWDRVAGAVEPKSHKGRRTVPVPAVLRDFLDEQKLVTGGEGLVFGRAPERPFDPSTVTARALSAWSAAGLEPITLHSARHCFASLMIAAGVNAKALSTYMGHASITITIDRYGHLMPGNEDEAAALLDAYLERADTAARVGALD